MPDASVFPFSPEVTPEREAREEHHAHLQENQPLARPLFQLTAAPFIAVNSGHWHLRIGKRLWISENKTPVADIALLTPEGQIVYGFIGTSIGAQHVRAGGSSPPRK